MLLGFWQKIGFLGIGVIQGRFKPRYMMPFSSSVFITQQNLYKQESEDLVSSRGPKNFWAACLFVDLP